MIWVLVHAGRIVARGSYDTVLGTAEEWQVLERLYHADGTVTGQRLARGWSVLPEVMVAPQSAEAA